jgi:hypothetical protein
MNIHGCPGISMGYPWISMNIHGYTWISMDIGGGGLEMGMLSSPSLLFGGVVAVHVYL